MRNSIFGAAALALSASLAGSAGAQTIISANVEADTTWSGTVILNGGIFVKNNAVLTIEPGTIVRGQPRLNTVIVGDPTGTPGTLVVTQTGTIVANGTPTNPIIMTTAAVDNDNDNVADDLDGNGFRDAYPGFEDNSCPADGGAACVAAASPVFLDDTPTTAPLAPLNPLGGANVQLWGGLVILGNATTNLGNGQALGQGIRTVEGLTVPGFPVADAQYGASFGTPGADADSSGSLSYVSIRHAGEAIDTDNELNGVTLGGVGSGTEFHHVEVYANFDDGIEWFGGTVNGHHLQVSMAGDDVFDGDQGYRGTNQFLLGILPNFNTGLPVNGLFGTASGDKGCEFDGDDSDTAPPNVNQNPASVPAGQPTPFQNYNMWNLTISGSRPGGASFNGHTNDNDGCEMRNGFAGSINNALIFNTGSNGAGVGGRQALDLAGGGVTNWTIDNNTDAGLVEANAVTCNNTQVLPALPANRERTAFANGASNDGSCLSGINSPNWRMNDDNPSFVPTGVAGKLDASLGSFDLRPSLPNATMAGGLVPSAPLDTTATYRGAFDAVSVPWNAGWTVYALANMQAVPEPGMASMVAAGAMGLLAASRRRR